MTVIRPEVEVLAKREGRPIRGSGVVIGADVALTTDHIAGRTLEVTIRTQEDSTIYQCEVLWRSEQHDIALLRVTDPGWKQIEVPAAEFGEVAGEGLLPCQITGFPTFNIDPISRIADTYQVAGTIAPLSSARAGTLIIRVDPPQITRPNEQLASPWAGMAGAPVICQGLIVGIVRSSRAPDNIAAIRVSKLAEEADFRKRVESAIGKPLVLERVARVDIADKSVNAVIDEVANADLTNTQQIGALQLALSKAYYERVLSQARASFISALIAAAIGLGFFLAAVAFVVFTGEVDGAILATISGGIVEAVAGLNFWLYSRTSEQLDAFHLRLDRLQRSLLANSVATGIEDVSRKDHTLSALVTSIAAGTTESVAPRLKPGGS